MESKYLVVERHHDYFVKVYWSDNPEDIIWEGFETLWYECLQAYEVEPNNTETSMGWLFGYDIVYK